METYSLLQGLLQICAWLTVAWFIAFILSKAIVITDEVHIRMVSVLGRRWRILKEGFGVIIPLIESSQQYKLEKERTEFDENFNSMAEDADSLSGKKKIDAVLRLKGSVQWIASRTFEGYCRFQQQTKERINQGLYDSIVSSIAVIAGQHTPEDLIQNLRALLLMIRDLLMMRQPTYENYELFVQWAGEVHADETTEDVEKRKIHVGKAIDKAKGDDGKSILPQKRIEFYNTLYAYIDSCIRYYHARQVSRLEEEFGIEISEVAIGSPELPQSVQDANAAARRIKREQEAQEEAHKQALRRAREYRDPAKGVGDISGEAALDRALLVGKGGSPEVKVNVHDVRGIDASIAAAIKALKGGS